MTRPFHATEKKEKEEIPIAYVMQMHTAITTTIITHLCIPHPCYPVLQQIPQNRIAQRKEDDDIVQTTQLVNNTFRPT
jgi:hypothetical protein